MFFQDPDGRLWCSTKVDKSGIHVGKKGYWGYCEKWSYAGSCKNREPITKLQDYLDNALNIKGIII